MTDFISEISEFQTAESKEKPRILPAEQIVNGYAEMLSDFFKDFPFRSAAGLFPVWRSALRETECKAYGVRCRACIIT